MAERELLIGGRRLFQLKVDELKAELEKRGLKKSGNKGILIERLQEALDKELELQEEYEDFSVPPQTQLQAARLQAAKHWQHPMMSPQSSGFPVQPIGMQQGMIVNQPQAVINQKPVMITQQQQQITSPVQVSEYREPWPQAPVPQPQMLYHPPQQQPRIPDQQPSQLNSDIPTHTSNHQVDVRQPVAPEVESSSSSSDSDQKPDEQSSSSSDRDRDSDEQPREDDRERITSPLNYSGISQTERNSSVVASVEKPHPKEENTADVHVDKEPVSGMEKQAQSEGEEERVTQDKEEKENMKQLSPKEKLAEASHQQSPPAEENTFEVEPSEEDKAVVEEPKVPLAPKLTTPIVTRKRKISIPRTSLPTTPSSSESQPASRKRRWGSSSASKKRTSMSISTDSLKDLIPGVQLHSTPALEAVMDLGDDDNDDEEEEEEKKIERTPKEEEETPENHTHLQPVEKEEGGRKRRDRIVKVEETKTIKLHRKTVVVEEETEEQKVEVHVEEEPVVQITDNPHPRHAPVQETSSPVPAERSPSPARNPERDVLHVKNLVRPFTLNQLKELLGKHGTLTDDGFWIDKIKSHCYVVYTSVEEAAASRQALHGVKWPLTSPKVLSVDFADDEEVAQDTQGTLGKKKEKEEKEEVKPEKEIKKEEEKPVEEEEEEQKNPGNLLDNLFRKTKTTPCLYWLPLSDDQIVAREQERENRRKQRQDERNKEDEERKERQQQREKEREKDKDKDKEKRDTEKPRSRSPRGDWRRERSRSRSRGGPRRH